MRRARLVAASLLASSTVLAAPDIKGRLSLYETEARVLAADLPRPNQQSLQTGQRRLVDAQVAYSIGDYDSASLALFDLLDKTQGADHELAMFYLAESLFHKGDRGAARVYYQELTKTAATKYYEPSLIRLVEIAITDKDVTGGQEAIGKLNSATPVATYTRGKWAFAQGKYDEAIGLFNSVARGSEYDAQATYYAATTNLAKGDLAKATEMFTELTTRKPKTNNDRRVIELAQLALGRLFYEREQPAKSIDSYLLVDRRSDLFPAALYEVGWVYVKNKQFDKALVALELLGRLDPESTTTPTVKILEGNLRIRKAQMIRQAQINGTLNADERSDPQTEYDKAEKIFGEVHDQYQPAYVALDNMVKGQLAPISFIDQISGRNKRVTTAAAPIPEAAAQWLREEPEVQRVVSVENDLAQIAQDIQDSEQIIQRLEAVLATNDHLTIYPLLAARRMRIAGIEHDLIGIRNELAEQALRSGGGSPETGNRRALAQQYAAVGDPERAHGERTGLVQQEYDRIGDNAQEVEGAIMSTQAMAVALRTYALTNDKPDLQKQIDDVSKDAQAIEDELRTIDREIVLGKDLAAVGDEDLKRARELRRRLKAAQDAEQRRLAGKISPLADQAARIASSLEQTDDQIDKLVGQGIDEVKRMLTQERTNIAEYKKLLAEYEQESRSIGSDVLGFSFKAVKAKLYDIYIRSDVGNIDVTWSKKEDTNDDLKRLNLARARDLKQIRDEFKFILDENVPAPALRPQKTTLPPASQEGPTSPDKGGGTDQRVKPAGDQTKDKTQPSVKPDATDTKATTPKATPKKKTTTKTTTPKKTGGTP